MTIVMHQFEDMCHKSLHHDANIVSKSGYHGSNVLSFLVFYQTQEKVVSEKSDVSASKAPKKAVLVTILYATQTGTAKRLSNKLAKQLRRMKMKLELTITTLNS